VEADSSTAKIVIAGSLSALVPPVPKYKNLPETWEATSLEGNFLYNG
jgi:hypothetical protein